jgi:hypothetical protein
VRQQLEDEDQQPQGGLCDQDHESLPQPDPADGHVGEDDERGHEALARGPESRLQFPTGREAEETPTGRAPSTPVSVLTWTAGSALEPSGDDDASSVSESDTTAGGVRSASTGYWPMHDT